jgi:Protein kinase domain
MQGIRTTMMARINSQRYTLACAAAAAAGAAAISSLFGDPSTDQDEEQIESNHHSTITSIATIPRHRNERQWWWQTPTNWALPSTPLCRCDNSSETVLQSSSSSSRMPVQRSIRFSKRITDAVPRNVRLEDLFQVHWDTPLGEGGFGSVYSATDRSSGELVACKQMSKECTDDVAFQREMEAFLHLREHGGHPNICTLRETFEEGSDYYLILDLILGGEMFDHLIRQ